MERKANALLVHIEHSKPIEINEFASSLNAIGTLFTTFAQSKGDHKSFSQAKLYVEKIEECCIDVFLCETISSNLIPFVENINIILDFSLHIKNIIEYYTKGKGEEPKLSLQELKCLRDVFQPTSSDRGGSTTISAILKENKEVRFNNCTFNFSESNSSQNQIDKSIEHIKSIQPSDNVIKNQLMVIYQMRSDMSSDTGNKAVIDSISKNRIGLVFETEELKKKILYTDYNPTKKAFYVDVVVMTANSKIAAYKVTALHDVVDLED